VAAAHPGLRGGRTASPEPGVAGATFRGGSRASHDLYEPPGHLPPPLFLKVFFFIIFLLLLRQGYLGHF